jgi:hypothetical protein
MSAIYKGVVDLGMVQNNSRGPERYRRDEDPMALKRWHDEGAPMFVQMIYVEDSDGSPKRGERTTRSLSRVWVDEDGFVCVERRKGGLCEWWRIRGPYDWDAHYGAPE